MATLPSPLAPPDQATRTMRAAQISSPGVVEMVEMPVPEPGAGEIRLRVEGCGVCASNLPPWEGRPWFQYPLAAGDLGHEAYGTIEALGAEVTEWQVGQRVAALSYRAYAEYDLASTGAIVALPGSLNSQPFPAEPLGCALNIFRRSGITKGDTVAIVGIGFLGALLTELAANAGARVIAIARRRYAQGIARAMGAADVIPMEDHNLIIEHVRSLTGGRFCDVVIEAVGKQWPLDLAAELTRERGRLVVAGYHQDGPRQVNLQLWNWRGMDVINAHERDPGIYLQGMQEAVRAVEQGQLNPGPLYTHHFPLDRLAQALEITRERPDGFFKAIVTP